MQNLATSLIHQMQFTCCYKVTRILQPLTSYKIFQHLTYTADAIYLSLQGTLPPVQVANSQNTLSPSPSPRAFPQETHLEVTSGVGDICWLEIGAMRACLESLGGCKHWSQFLICLANNVCIYDINDLNDIYDIYDMYDIYYIYDLNDLNDI